MNWKAVGITLVASFTLTACGNNGQDVGQNGLDNGVQQTRFNSTTDYPSPTGNTGNYRNTRIGMNENNTGTYQGMFSNNRGNRNNTNDYGANQRNRNINNQAGLNDNNRNNNNLNNTNMNNNNGADQNINNQNRYEVANEAAERITDDVNQVDEAYVLTTNNNAYVAVELDRQNNNDNDQQRNGDTGNNVSVEIEQKVRRAVRSVNNNIENVYVSTNPDFVNLTNNYVDDVDNGEPVEGFFDQFGEMIERIFPRAR